MKHRCHAAACETEVPPELFMCKKHWKMVPRKLQTSIWNEYKPGQEIDKDPTLMYLAVQQLAVGEVALKEGMSAAAQEAFRNSQRYSSAVAAAAMLCTAVVAKDE